MVVSFTATEPEVQTVLCAWDHFGRHLVELSRAWVDLQCCGGSEIPHYRERFILAASRWMSARQITAVLSSVPLFAVSHVTVSEVIAANPNKTFTGGWAL